MNIQKHQSSAAKPPVAGEAAPVEEMLQRLRRRENLSRQEASALLDSVLDPETSDSQIAGSSSTMNTVCRSGDAGSAGTFMHSILK